MTEIIGYDYDTILADGSDNITQTLMTLLNQYPGMESETAKYIDFQLLDTVSGIAMFPSPSVAILTENESITGRVRQTCSYGFTVVYRTRTSNPNKERVKEWLDNLGRWIEKTEYPKLNGGKEFVKIARTTQAYLYGTTEDKAEDWAISLQATYSNEFDK